MFGELHSGGLRGHFGNDKTATLVKVRYFFLSVNKDVSKFIEGYMVCQLAKGKGQKIGLYTPLRVP